MSALSLRRLVGVRALSAVSYYAFIPFLPLWAERNLGVSGLAAGAALAVSLLATRAGGLVLPPLIETVGYARFIRLSYGAIAVGYLVLAWQSRFGALELVTVLALVGLLQSGSTVALKASVAGLAAPSDRGAAVRGFGALSMAVNAGSAVGPVFGALLLDAGRWALPALAAAAMAVAALLLLGAEPGPAGAVPASGALHGFGWPGRPLVHFLLAGSLTWVAYAAAFDAMPTAASRLVDRSVVAIAFALNAIVVVIGQPLATRWLTRRPERAARPWPRLLATANLLAAGGLAVMALLPWAGPAGLLAGVLIFSSSELIWGPLYDAETLARAGRVSPAAAFGLAGCVFGVAESAAAWGGVAVAGSGSAVRAAAMFGTAAAAALLPALLLIGLQLRAGQPPSRRPPSRRPPSRQPPSRQPQISEVVR